MRVFDTNGLTLSTNVMRAGLPIRGALFYPASDRVLAWGSDYPGSELYVWDANSGTQIGKSGALHGTVKGAAITSDGKRIVTWTHGQAPNQGAVELWKAEQVGRRAGPSMCPDVDMTDAILRPDGKRLLTWKSNGTAQIWDIDGGLPIGTIADRTRHRRGDVQQRQFPSSDLGRRQWFGSQRRTQAVERYDGRADGPPHESRGNRE